MRETFTEEIAPPEPQRLFDPGHWLDRVRQAREKAKALGDPEARETMLHVASQYERLARLAQRQFQDLRLLP